MEVALFSLTIVVVIVSIISLVLQITQARRANADEPGDAAALVREEFRCLRDESRRQARDLREEVSGGIGQTTELLVATLNAARKDQLDSFEGVVGAIAAGARTSTDAFDRMAERTQTVLRENREASDARLEAIRATTEEKLVVVSESQQKASAAIEGAVRDLAQSNREELTRQRDGVQGQLQEFQSASVKAFEHVRTTVETKLADSSDQQHRRSAEVVDAVRELSNLNRSVLEQQREAIQAQVEANRVAMLDALTGVRATVEEKLRLGQEDQRKHLADVLTALGGLSQRFQESQEKARETIDSKLQQIQESNERKLEEMRQTVDEKLHKTLETRLGESFKLVSERLEAVQKGLGEMQSLASGVGDLKRVLTNVKDRGTWGEYQLGSILEQVLTPDQYGRNVQTTGSGERVEFAVRMPGEGHDLTKPVWLPIDAKFPKEEYERLVAASQAVDIVGVEDATKRLLALLLKSAKDIHDKYVSPPLTTDFAIMFLPTEGLYAEALRQPGFQDEVQRTYRVLIAGPATLAAILTSLRVGFQTLAIEQRAGEIWEVLRAVKTEFGKFGEHLARVKKQLQAASNTIESTQTRTRAMVRKLKEVEQLPAGQSKPLLGLPDDLEDEPVVEDEEVRAPSGSGQLSKI